jgi:hypothetical protein
VRLELSGGVSSLPQVPQWNAVRRARSAERVAAPAGAETWINTRLPAFCFLYLFVVRMERSEIREDLEIRDVVPGFRFAQSGLRLQTLIVMKPVTTTGFI